MTTASCGRRKKKHDGSCMCPQEFRNSLDGLSNRLAADASLNVCYEATLFRGFAQSLRAAFGRLAVP